MKTIVRLSTFLFVLLFVTTSLYAGRRDPVAVLYQVKGQVEYSKDGQEWKKVRRNKFLFPGYQVRSLEDGSGKITIKSSGEKMNLKPDTTLEVTAVDLMVVKGDLKKAEPTSSLIAGLIKKFSRSQSYTTVRRSANKRELDAVREIVLSEQHPYLVWDNMDKNYAYKLTVGDQTYSVAPQDDDVIRVKVDPFTGTREFKITAMKDDQVIAELQPYRSRGELKHHTAKWLGETQKRELNEVKSDLTEEYGDGTFLLGTYYENVDMWVAAMEHYQAYLQENPDDIEMKPYLFRVYKKLKLDGLYQKELNQWNQAMAN